MITCYWIIVTTLISCLFFLFLTKYGFILKKSKLRRFLKSELMISFCKKVIFIIFSLFISITIVFLLTELLPKEYSNNTYLNYPHEEKAFILKLLSYFHDILPFPKKVCSVTYLENGNLVCAEYTYSLINLGVSNSYMKNIPVIEIIKEKCTVSFLFGLLAYILQCVIGYPLGIYLAKNENKPVDKAFNFFNILIRVIPSVIYFYLFVILFMVVFNLPVLFDFKNVLSYIAPLSALTIVSSLSVAYFSRKYILLELDKDYVVFAKSKGLSDSTILYKHVLRNAFVPFIRTIPASILTCFSGFYILEASFNIPGVGLTLIDAIQLQDVPLMRGLIIFFIFLSMIAFVIGDILTLIFKRRVDLVKEAYKDGRN